MNKTIEEYFEYLDIRGIKTSKNRTKKREADGELSERNVAKA